MGHEEDNLPAFLKKGSRPQRKSLDIGEEETVSSIPKVSTRFKVVNILVVAFVVLLFMFMILPDQHKSIENQARREKLSQKNLYFRINPEQKNVVVNFISYSEKYQTEIYATTNMVRVPSRSPSEAFIRFSGKSNQLIVVGVYLTTDDKIQPDGMVDAATYTFKLNKDGESYLHYVIDAGEASKIIQLENLPKDLKESRL